MTTSPQETRVGPYRLLAHIGEGGMGVVHLAQGPDGRRVALKVLRPHVVGDAEARERLAQEVSSLQRVSSPRIAEIVDADPHGPLPYVVTRYVPGLSLYHHVAEEGVVSGRDLLHFAGCLAEALAAVHAVGVLHRDVKPTNVLMEGRSPVLIDFGLARVADDPRLTQTGFLLGTPGYLAPEILYGDDATTASDVHAWAATVVYAATGRSPYGTGPTMAILDRVRRGQHDLSGVPSGPAALLREALSPEHLDRPTVPELRAEVARLQAEDGGAAVRPGTRQHTGPDPEPWTMPFAPVAGSPDARPTEARSTGTRPPDARPTDAGPAEVPATVSTPLDDGTVAMRPAAPYQQPPPPTTTVPAPTSTWPIAPRRPSTTQRRLQLLGLGALSTAMVAYAPYLGTALVGLVVLALRSVSITRQRHDRRRTVRGRPRWYDVPATTLSTPAYVALALLGTVADVVIAALVGLALFSLGYLLQQGVAVCLVLAGLGFTPALWWGPGSDRLRETTHRLVRRTAASEFGGWFVAAMSLLGAAVVLGLLLGSGANWAPALAAPWR